MIRKLNLTANPAFQPHESRAHRLLAYIKTDLLHVKETNTPKFGEKESGEDTALILYKKRLSAFNDGRSLTLDLAFELEDPDLATKIVNDHADAYIAAQIAYRYSEANIKVQWMKKQLDASAQQLHAAEVALQTHAIGSNTQGADQTAELKSKKAFADAQETVYTSLLSRYNIMAAERNYVGSDTRIVSPAIVPTHPKFPNTPLFIAIAGVVSLIGGCVAAWVSSLFGRTLDAEGLGFEMGTSYLGTVRFPRPGSMAGTGTPRRMRRAAFWEQIRTVRSSLGINVADGSVILVTSHSPHEGKSVVAASLARAVASSGTRTLLLDADMRRPSAHKLLGLSIGRDGQRDHWSSQDQPSTKAIVPGAGRSRPVPVLAVAVRGRRRCDVRRALQVRGRRAQARVQGDHHRHATGRRRRRCAQRSGTRGQHHRRGARGEGDFGAAAQGHGHAGGSWRPGARLRPHPQRRFEDADLRAVRQRRRQRPADRCRADPDAPGGLAQGHRRRRGSGRGSLLGAPTLRRLHDTDHRSGTRKGWAGGA